MLISLPYTSSQALPGVSGNYSASLLFKFCQYFNISFIHQVKTNAFIPPLFTKRTCILAIQGKQVLSGSSSLCGLYYSWLSVSTQKRVPPDTKRRIQAPSLWMAPHPSMPYSYAVCPVLEGSRRFS